MARLLAWRQPCLLFKTVLSPGAIALIAIRQAAAETVRQAFGALQASNHGSDVNIALTLIGIVGFIQERWHSIVWFILFGY